MAGFATPQSFASPATEISPPAPAQADPEQGGEHPSPDLGAPAEAVATEPADARRRTIAARESGEKAEVGEARSADHSPPATQVELPAARSSTQEPIQTAAQAPVSGTSSAQTEPALSLSALVPPKRAPVPMVTRSPPKPETSQLRAANDGAGTPLSLPDTLDEAGAGKPAALVPPPRSQTTLGLGTSPTPAAPVAATGQPDAAAALGPNRSTGFSVSDQPPELSYQDELILEIQVKGIDASDTILAYGTRTGVYLPIGTLARILDLAITVGDEGHYASGWVLDPERTLTIDLRQYLLTVDGKERALPRSAAVAFDGELYLLAERMADFLPLTVETDLRSQKVTLETLEPFPFEERMKREADRRRLASRGQARNEERFPRQETPWLLASLPVADVELRAVSDSAFGPRGEIDVQMAGDLGYLTARSFISADTANGLTASLIEVGRQDPDAQLLGPLAATAFAAGDVSTTALPLGLRGVTGRGFTVTNTPPEAVSVFEKIDLRGVLPDGYEVELYRNDILIGSTRDTVNGQYEFLQVPVDFGLNVFRLVFFGPQGQRSEEVRRITVGDGRLPQGKLVYRVGAVEKDENVLGVRPPNFIAPRDFGSWRTTAELAYGLTSDVTTVLSGGWFETATQDRWLASAGVRTGLGSFALKGDVAAANGGAMAFSAGVGGRFGNSAVTLSHIEYSGDFVDETRSISGEFLRRATELDFNTTINLGNPVSGLVIPVTARARHQESTNGRLRTDATMRASTRMAGLLVSNTLEYNRTSLPQLETQSRLFGNFDLSTLGRSRTRGRVSLGYEIAPNPDIVSANLEMDHAIDENTAIRGSVGYAFQTKSTQIGLSAVRDFDRFSLALDGNYGFRDNSYSVGLRLGFSFGRDPLRGNLFIARPGLASSGGASVRAFRDMDGDGVFGPVDTPLPEVGVVTFNQTKETGEDGIARIGNLGSGKGVSVQIDSSTLPDIDLAPAVDGIEIVPRPGRLHTADFPIVALSEIEGTLRFTEDGNSKGVSGVRLQLRNAAGEEAGFAKTEIDGYFFFERVKPGEYSIILDPGQAKRLSLCADRNYGVTVGFEADLLSQDIDIGVCETAE